MKYTSIKWPPCTTSISSNSPQRVRELALTPDENTVIQRSKGTCSRSHSQQAVQPGFEPSLEMLKICGGEGRGIGDRERGVGQVDGKGE